MTNENFDHQRYNYEFSKERYYYEKYGNDWKMMLEFDESCDRIENQIKESIKNIKEINKQSK